jgi:hypothetical protein
MTSLEQSDIPLLQTCRLTELPTGGTVLDKTPFDTLSGSNANVIVRGGSSLGLEGVRGVVLTPITTSVKSISWQTVSYILRTVEGQHRYEDRLGLPELIKHKSYVLLPNEAISIRLYDVPFRNEFAGNSSLQRHFVQCVWEEESI